MRLPKLHQCLSDVCRTAFGVATSEGAEAAAVGALRGDGGRGVKRKSWLVRMTPRPDVHDKPIDYGITNQHDHRVAGYRNLVRDGLYTKMELVEVTSSEKVLETVEAGTASASD